MAYFQLDGEKKKGNLLENSQDKLYNPSRFQSFIFALQIVEKWKISNIFILRSNVNLKILPFIYSWKLRHQKQIISSNNTPLTPSFFIIVIAYIIDNYLLEQMAEIIEIKQNKVKQMNPSKEFHTINSLEGKKANLPIDSQYIQIFNDRLAPILVFQQKTTAQNVNLRKRKLSLHLQFSFLSRNLKTQKTNFPQSQSKIPKTQGNLKRRICKRNTISIPQERQKYQTNNNSMMSKQRLKFARSNSKTIIHKSRTKQITKGEQVFNIHRSLQTKRKEKQFFNTYDKVSQHYNHLHNDMQEKPNLKSSQYNNIRIFYEKYLIWRHNQKIQKQAAKQLIQKKQIEARSPKIISQNERVRRNFIKRRNSINIMKSYQIEFSDQFGKLLYH